MNPPENIQGIYLKKYDNNKFNINFKSKLKPNNYLINEFNKDIIEVLFKYGTKYNYEFDKENKTIKLKNIKLENVNYSVKKQMGSVSTHFIIKNYYSNENSHTYELEYQNVIKDRVHETIDGIICKLSLNNLNFSINVSYTDNIPNKINLQKHQTAHFFRNSLIPFKLEIEK